MADALRGMRILVPESRELDLFAAMLEAEGAQALRCPLVHILDLEDTQEAETWIGRLIAGQFQDVMWLTGEGLRRLVVIAEKGGLGAAFVAAVGRTRSITRGPKPVRALREIGLAPQLAASAPISRGFFFSPLSIAEERLVDSFSIDRPPTNEQCPGFWSALFEVLQQTPTILICCAPKPYACCFVANPVLFDGLPAKFVEDFGVPSAVSSGAEIEAAVTRTALSKVS